LTLGLVDKSLNEVVVSDTHSMMSKRDIPAVTESVTAEQIADSINLVNTEDALKYMPGLNIRKRFEGDRNGIIATRTSGTLQSAKSLVYGDGILLSMLLGNSYSYPPRWFMVAPEEVERIDVTYGPFSALYPGNSTGVVVDMITRMPSSFEAHTRAQTYDERFSLFGTNSNYTGNQLSATLGNKNGAFTWWIGLNRSQSTGHPASFATLTSITSTPASFKDVTGGFTYRDQNGVSQIAAGGYASDNSLQENAKAKLAYDFSPDLKMSYTFAVLSNDASTNTQTYLFDSSGNAVYGQGSSSTGYVRLNGSYYSLSSTLLKPSKTDQTHIMQALALRQQSDGAFDWELIASTYDFQRDVVRAPSYYTGATSSTVAGTNTNQAGTGWQTLDARGIWRPDGENGAHRIFFGYHIDRFVLDSLVMNTSSWLAGTEVSKNSSFQGKTEAQALYIQDNWRFSPRWMLVSGLRAESWRAFDGSKYASSTTTYAKGRQEDYLSPKLALTFEASRSINTRLSLGRGVRMPTVNELYNGTISSSGIASASDANLKAERNDAAELTIEKIYPSGLARISVFQERSNDAIWAQTVGSTSTITNIDLLKTTGAETSAQFQDVGLKGLSLQGSLTYADSFIAKNTLNQSYVGNPQPRVPLWRASLLAAYAPDARWIYSLGARYSGPVSSSITSGLYDQRAYGGVSDFFIVDAKIRYRIDKHASASIGINNLNNFQSYVVHPNSQRTVIADLKYDFP